MGIVSEFRSKILHEVYSLLNETGQQQPPFNPELLAFHRKVIDIRREKLTLPGTLTPVTDGFVLKLNSNDPPRRQRVTCAHEVGHTFFYDITASPPLKIRFGSQKDAEFGLEEHLCNQIAAEILMPTPVVSQDISECAHPLLKYFFRLMNRYDVSSEFLAWRLNSLQEWRAIIILFAQADFGKRRTPRAFSQESTRHDSVANPIPKTKHNLQVWKVFKHAEYRKIKLKPGLAITEDLSPSVALRSRTQVVTREHWELGDLKGTFYVQSRFVESRPPHVVSIVVPDEQYANYLMSLEPEQTQTSLF